MPGEKAGGVSFAFREKCMYSFLPKTVNAGILSSP